ncbi:MAG: hypothetical protein AAGA11_22320 [Pseudomonadota bacterium]
MKHLIMLCSALTLWIGAASLPLHATDGIDPLFGSCESSPEEAVLTLGDETVAHFARVACTVFGHIVMPTERYFWSFYGGVAPVVLTAQDDGPDAELTAVFNDVYFTAIDAGELSGDAARRAFEGARFGDHFGADVQPTVYAIRTESNTGVSKTLYLYTHGEQIAGAIPYPEWFERIDDRPLLPIFVLDRTTVDTSN